MLPPNTCMGTLLRREYASPTGASRILTGLREGLKLQASLLIPQRHEAPRHCVRLFWAPAEGQRGISLREGKQPDLFDPVRRSQVLKLECLKVARLFISAFESSGGKNLISVECDIQEKSSASRFATLPRSWMRSIKARNRSCGRDRSSHGSGSS